MEKEIKYTEVYAGRLKYKKYFGDEYDIELEDFTDARTPSTKWELFDDERPAVKFVYGADFYANAYNCYYTAKQQANDMEDEDPEDMWENVLEMLKQGVDRNLKRVGLSYGMPVKDFHKQMIIASHEYDFLNN